MPLHFYPSTREARTLFLFPLPLWERVAPEWGSGEGFVWRGAQWVSVFLLRSPLIRHALHDTFSRKGEKDFRLGACSRCVGMMCMCPFLID
jgi:hypothetical protein